jgi:LPS sulfotransferase NodH
VYTHHRFDHEFPPGTEVTCAYVVCSVPRSGSSLLCELLCLSGVAGAPTEYLDAEQRRRFCEAWGARDLDEYVAMLLDKKTSPNGVFGLKTHFDQMGATLGDRDLFDVFGDLRVVYIRRADHVEQAVSYAIAMQSNQWASTHAATGPAVFDRAQITRLLDQIERDEQRWEEWFAVHDVAPLRIEYADLVADRLGTTAEVLGHLGIDPGDDLDGLEPTLERQADRRSRRWALRYRSRPRPRRR